AAEEGLLTARRRAEQGMIRIGARVVEFEPVPRARRHSVSCRAILVADNADVGAGLAHRRRLAAFPADPARTKVRNAHGAGGSGRVAVEHRRDRGSIRHALAGAGGADELAAVPAPIQGLGSARRIARVLEHDLAVVGAAAARPHAGPLQSVALDRLGMAYRGTVEALGALLGAAVEAVV